MKYYRIHETEIAWATKKPRGVFVAVWRLLDKGLFSESESAEYYKNRLWFEDNLPVPPFYETGNKENAITWYKNTKKGNELAGKMNFYFAMAKKYDLTLFKTETDHVPGKIIYEDEFQIAVIDSCHEGEGYITEVFDL